MSRRFFHPAVVSLMSVCGAALFASVALADDVPIVPVNSAQGNSSPNSAPPRENRTLEGESDRPAGGADKNLPASSAVITSDAIRNGSAQNTFDALQNVPGVTQSDAKGGSVADNVQIRGIHLSSTTGFRLDGGLPIVNNLIMPIEDKERIEALKGVSALEFGLASPGGVVDLVMKRATDRPNFSFGVASNEYGQLISTLDMGMRFGEGNQFGIRTILSGGELVNGIHDITGTRGLGAVAADWQPSQRFSLKLDFEEFGVDTLEQATLLQNKPVNNRVILPAIPNYYQLLSGTWAKYQGIGQNVLLSGTYKLDYGFSVVAEAGRSESLKGQRNLGQVGTYNVVTGLGKETVSLIDDQDSINTYVKGELKHRFEYKWLTSDLTLGINRNERDFNDPTTGSFSFAQNIYTPIATPTPPSPVPGTNQPNNSYDLDYYVQEDVGLFGRLHVIGGVREINYNAIQVVSTTTNHFTDNAAAPSIGAVFEAFPGVSVYASYLKSLDETGAAPANATNAFQIQPPAEATQKEVGIKATNLYNATATFAAFEIVQANAITDSVTNIFGINGTQTIKGLESTFSYKILPALVDLTLVSGGQVGYAYQTSTDPAINGMESENVPRISGNLGLVYRPDFFRGVTLNGGAVFTGSRELTNEEQGKLPAVTIFNAGANYVTNYEGHRLTFNVTCKNLLDKAYYSSAVNGALGIGAPRTVFFGGQIDF
jgi:iron complex outermembrane recepter protein